MSTDPNQSEIIFHKNAPQLLGAFCCLHNKNKTLLICQIDIAIMAPNL